MEDKMLKLMYKFNSKLAVVGLAFCLAAWGAVPLAAQTTIVRGAGNTLIEGGT
jgi:hypothetical protein